MRFTRSLVIAAAISAWGTAAALAQGQAEVTVPMEAPQSQVAADAIALAPWISRLLTESGYKADFSLESLKEIDRFFDEQVSNGQPKPGGLLAEQLGLRLFALGAYVGEVIRRQRGGVWEGNDADPEAEFNIIVRLEGRGNIWPMQRVMKRGKNGPEDSIWFYGLALTRK